MSKISDNLLEAREKIQRRLRELDREERQSSLEAETMRKSKAQFKAWIEDIKRGISRQRLKEITIELDLKVPVVFPFTILARHFVKKRLEKRLGEVEVIIREIARRIKRIETERKDINICPNCGGRGFITKTRYIRENGFVTPMLTDRKCILCQGKGRF